MFTRIALYSFLFLLTATAAGQGVVRCDDGRIFWVITGNNRGFALPLEGDVSETNDDLINVEDKALHYYILDAKNYYNADGKNTDADILERFIKGEMDGLELEGLEPVKELRSRQDGESFLLWRHNWTSGNQVDTQVHATIVLSDTVIWLTCPKFIDMELAGVEAFVIKCIENLKEIENAEGLCE